MDKQDALNKMQYLLMQIPTLKEKERFSSDFAKWKRDTQTVIKNIFGRFNNGTDQLKEFDAIRYEKQYDESRWVGGVPEQQLDKDFRAGLEQAEGIIRSIIAEIDEYWTTLSEEQPRNYLETIERICTRFHLIARQLLVRHDTRATLTITDEYDVQDLLHALLQLEFNDIRPEEVTPSYAGSSSRMDFLLKPEKTVIEIKKTRNGLDAKTVGSQLIEDIARYKEHPNCQILVCFVYDPEGRISNPRGLENDLSGGRDGLDVKVIITPR